jgi:hypothetical protein
MFTLSLHLTSIDLRHTLRLRPRHAESGLHDMDSAQHISNMIVKSRLVFVGFLAEAKP